MEEMMEQFFIRNRHYYEVKKIEDADNYLVIDEKEKKFIYVGIVEWDTTEDSLKEKEKIKKIVYLKNTKIKKYKISKRKQEKIKKFKENIIKKFNNLLEVEKMEDADIVLIIHNDFTQWDVRENDNPNPRYLDFIKEIFKLSFFWLKRINEEENIDEILNYINKEIRK